MQGEGRGGEGSGGKGRGGEGRRYMYIPSNNSGKKIKNIGGLQNTEMLGQITGFIHLEVLYMHIRHYFVMSTLLNVRSSSTQT